MNRGLVLKAFRELWPATLLFGGVLGVVEGLLAFVLPVIQEQFSSQWAQLRFVQTLIRAMLGSDVAQGAGPELFLTVCWVHPVVLAITWAHAIIVCTRVPAGEVDRGTVDVLLGLPVSRGQLFLSETAVWLASALVILACALIGNAAGSSGVSADLCVGPSRLSVVAVNLFCLYLAVGGCAWLVSSLSDRRGKAMTVVFVLVLASFLLNYLAQFWEPARRVSFLSILSYYRPLFILRDGSWPWRDMVILVSAALALWLAAGFVFSRRDLSTV